MASLRILLDNNMSTLIGDVFAARGHDVEQVRMVLSEHEADLLIWSSATERNMVVVTFDRDFRSIATRFPMGQGGPFKRRAGLISLSGMQEAVARRRVDDLMPEIEFAHERSVQRRLRFIFSITATSYTVVDNAALRPEP